MKTAHFFAHVVVASLLAAPAFVMNAEAQAGGSTDIVTFYGHVFGHGATVPMPANTQFPYGSDNYGLGTFDWCVDGVIWTDTDAAEPQANCYEDDPNNKLILYSTAGFVEVSNLNEFTGEGGYVQLHNERGMTKDALLDKTKEMTASLVLSLDLHAWSVWPGGPTYCPLNVNPRDVGCLYPYWGWDPGVQPDFVVRAGLYYAIFGPHGSAASDQPPAWDHVRDGSAVLVASGETSPETITVGLPGYPNYHRFDIALGTPQVDMIPKEANFFLVYDFFSRSSGTEWTAQTWRIWSGEFFPPYFTLPVKNAFDVETVIPQFVHDKLVILGVLNTPWGSYDINPHATKLTIRDASNRDVTPASIEMYSDYSVAHGGHYIPVNVTYVWDYKNDNLPEGKYSVEIGGSNYQRSSTASCKGSFTVGRNGAPGPVEIGQCGFQSASDEFLDEIQQGARGSATSESTGNGDGRDVAGLPSLPVSLQSVGATPVASGAGPLALLGILAFAGVALLIRRWSP